MTTTLDEIHRDPAIIDRAISRRETLEIVADGEVTATLLPKLTLSVAEARRVMQARFATPDWEFTVGAPMSRDERNAGGAPQGGSDTSSPIPWRSSTSSGRIGPCLAAIEPCCWTATF